MYLLSIVIWMDERVEVLVVQVYGYLLLAPLPDRDVPKLSFGTRARSPQGASEESMIDLSFFFIDLELFHHRVRTGKVAYCNSTCLAYESDRFLSCK